MEGGRGYLEKISRYLKQAVAFFRDGLFPDFCAGCGKEGEVVCAACWQRIPFVTQPRMVDGLTIWSVADFHDQAVRGAVHALKYTQRAEAGALVRQALARWSGVGAIHELPLPAGTHWHLIPIPMHAKRQRERGANQAETLATLLASIGWGSVDPVLLRTRHTKSQTTLDRAGRQQNIKGAFALHGTVDPNASYLIIDDVTTTGATLKEAADTLRHAGATQVSAWTFAVDL